MHGFFVEGKNDGMGAAKLKSVFDMYSADKTLILDAGDATQGSSLVTLSEGATAIDVMNALGYDAMVAGNHEFDFGQALLEKNVAKAKFPVLSSNIKKGGLDYLTPYIIKEVDGVKVAIFGLSTREAALKSHPDKVAGLTFEEPITIASALVPKLETMADVIVCLAHLGDEAETTSEDVAKAVTGIDVILDGHSHSSYAEGLMVGDTLIASTGEKTKNVGIVEIEFKDGLMINKSAKLFTKEDASDLEGDPVITELIDEIKSVNAVIENEIVSYTDVFLDGERANVRTGETNLGNLIAEALLDISGADVALTNGGGIRASIDVGDITKGEVLTVLPFGSTLQVLEISGADIIAAIENGGVMKAPESNGPFPHTAGMVIEYDSSKEPGQRVVSIEIDGKLVDETATYSIATNSFLAVGGGKYSMFVGKKLIAEYGTTDQVLSDFIKENGVDKAALTGRIKDIAK